MSGAVTGINQTASVTPIHTFVKFRGIFTLQRLNIESAGTVCVHEKLQSCIVSLASLERAGLRIIWELETNGAGLVGVDWMEVISWKY